MKRTWFIGLVLILWVRGSSWSSAEESLDHVRLQLKWRHQFQFAGYYSAIEQGFFREEGLEVELLEAEVGQNAFDVVLSGDAEFGVSNSEIVQRCAEGDPLVQLAVIYQHSPLVLLSIRDYGIETLHDLVGSTLMIEPNSAELLALFRAEGIDPDQIDQVPHNFSVNALIGGEVLAISAYYSDEPFDVIQHGHAPVIFTPRAAGIDFYGDGIFTTRDQLENHPERVEGFRRATIRGWEYALAHPEETIDLILSKYSQRKSRQQLEYEAMKTEQLVQADLVPVGYMNPGRWDFIADIFHEVGLTEDRVDPSSFLYRQASPFLWRKFFVLIVGLAALCLVVSGVAWFLFRSKIRLEAAIRRKQEVEGELRRSEAFYRSFYESAPLPFLYWDRDCRIRHWNPAAER
ncbi:MAG: ABC transporter substrate-binding protein, partial [Puniceicoccales bacterium]